MAAERFDPAAFLVALRRVPFAGWVECRPETGSTNDDALRLARAGAPEGTVVVADRQTSGRGRLGRAWLAEPGTALLASWIVRPAEAREGRAPIPVASWTLIPLVAGVAAAEGIRRTCRLDVDLKWPNDLVVGDRKLGGILTEAEPPGFVVVGLGLNVAVRRLPPEIREIATSVAAAGARAPGRPRILAAVLGSFFEAVADVPAALERYRSLCTTLGRRVRAERAGAPPVEGVARDVDATGALVIESAGGVVTLSAGDVTHIR